MAADVVALHPVCVHNIKEAMGQPPQMKVKSHYITQKFKDKINNKPVLLHLGFPLLIRRSVLSIFPRRSSMPHTERQTKFEKKERHARTNRVSCCWTFARLDWYGSDVVFSNHLQPSLENKQQQKNCQQREEADGRHVRVAKKCMQRIRRKWNYTHDYY